MAYVLTRRHLLGLGTLLTAGTLASCAGATSGAGDSAASGTADPSAEPTRGGELRFAIANDPGSLAPQGGGSGNDARYVTRQLFDSLLAQDPETGELVGWLAQEWESNEDATELTLTLREGVTFSDGTALTPQLVLDNFDDVISLGAVANYAIEHLAGYEGGQVLDERTLVVRFSEPSGPFLQALTEPMLAPLAAATLALDWDERAGGNVIGTGPFVLEGYTKDTEVVLVRREGYSWGPELASNTGEAYLDSVRFQVIPEASVRTGAISSDQVDVIGGVPPQDEEALASAGYAVLTRANPGVVFGLTPYTASPLAGEEGIRAALGLALNRTDLRDAALNESYAVATSPLASSTPGWTDLSEHIPEDAEKAAAILEEAGWREGADGIRAKDGRPLTLTIWWADNFVANQSTLELLQAQARQVGIDIALQTGDAAAREAAEESEELDFSYGNLSRADGDILRTQFLHTDEDPGQVPDPKLNDLLQRQRGLTGEDRDAVLEEAAVYVLDHALFTPVYELTSVFAVSPKVADLTLSADSRLAALTDAYLTEETS